MVDLRQSPAYAAYISSIGWKVLQISNSKSQIPTNIFIRSLGIFGAIAKAQRFSELDWPEVKKLLRRNKVWMTKLEPKTYNLEPSFHQDNWPMLATKTLQIDLRPSSERIFAGFKKDARYCLRKIINNQYSIINDDFDGFYKLWKKATGIKRLWIPSNKDYINLIKAFGKDVICLTVDGQAGALILIHDHVAYYYYAAALPIGKKRYLQYHVVWELMKMAKKLGCKVWDFEGIYDPRWPNKGWQGFSHFKKSFGGKEIDFPGSFTKWF